MSRLLGVAVAVALSLPATATAGPWTPRPNEGYVKVSARWLPALLWSPGPERMEATTQEERLLYGPYNEVFFGGYWEHGLMPRAAFWLSWEPAKMFILTDPRDGTTRVHPGVGEPILGVKVQAVSKGPFAMGFEVGVGFPLLDNRVVDDVYGLAAGNPRIAELRTGTGVWDLRPMVSFGAGFPRVYVAGGVGVSIRSGGWDTVLLWNAEVGRSIGPKGLGSLRVKLNGHHPLGNGTAPYHDSVSGIGNGTAYAGFTVELDRKVSENWSVGGSVAGGLGPVLRQTGGPVLALNVSAVY